MPNTSVIRVEGARQNNLKNLTFELPLNQLIVLTGLSGSGKTSLAFDTLYAEGQRRYTETFSPYARQFLERMDKPQADKITGIPPAIALEQANQVRTSRSTVGTATELADYLKLLFPMLAELRCPDCRQTVRPQTPEAIARELLKKNAGEQSLIVFEVPFPENTPSEEKIRFIRTQGFLRILHNGQPVRVDETGLKKLGDCIAVVQDRVRIEPRMKGRLEEALTAALALGKGTVAVHFESGKSGKVRKFSNHWFCPDDQREFDPPSSGMFSFNNPLGACPVCRGFGRTIEIDEDLALPDKSLSIAEGVVKPWQTGSFDECQRDLMKACKRRNVPTHIPYAKLTEKQKQFVLTGDLDGKRTASEVWEAGDWYGVKGFFDWLETRTYKMHVRVLLSRYRAYRTCPACGGGRLQERVKHWFLNGRTLPEINQMPVKELLPFFQNLSVNHPSAKTVHAQICARLSYLNQVGLGYLTLNRTTRTLSGGEFQRVNLTACLGAELTGTLFVLDEPSIGLHPRDTDLLLDILRSLRDRGNTVLVVEHDENVIRSADHVLELGPKQGKDGGELVFQGNAFNNSKTLTGQYLTGKRKIPVPSQRSKPKGWLKISGATKHNIQNQNFKIPLGVMTVVSGVSGSGKSTLVYEVVYKSILRAKGRSVDEPAEIRKIEGVEKIQDVILVDQTPLAKTPRSTPAVYTGAYDSIRALFASTDEAQSAGLTAGAFSFNSGEGRCERCWGMGFERIEMQFLSDLYVRCPACEGKRFQKHILNVRYQNQTLHDVLEMTIEEALEFFNFENIENKFTSNHHRKILSALQPLADVGLGYLRLGQPLNQLSGGEAQRVKLASHLAGGWQSSAKTGQLFILDEPTTGLHLEDVHRLMKALETLTVRGHSLLIIEHHPDVIKRADWLIDLGPEAGAEGGNVVAAGTPEHVSRHSQSRTAPFLKEKLKNKPLRKKPSPSKRSPKTSSQSSIEVRGARHHNLKNISLSIPLQKMTTLTGLSGSGKSTLAFDLIFSEGQRRYLDCLNSYARQFMEQMEKPTADSISGIPPTVAIEQQCARGGGKSTVATVTELDPFLRLLYAKLGVQHDPATGERAVRQTTDEVARRLRTRLRKEGAFTLTAPLIQGRKGYHTEAARWAVKKGFCQLVVDGKRVEAERFQRLDRYREHDVELVLGEVNSKNLESLLRDGLRYGKGTVYARRKGLKTIYSTHLFCPGSGQSFEELDPRQFSFNSPHGRCPACRGFGVNLAWEGDSELEREQSAEMRLENETAEGICPACGGTRLNPVSRAVRFAGKPVTELNAMTVRDLDKFFSKLKLDARGQTLARDILPEIRQRLKFLQKAGLDYLQLNRGARTLSGGEAQRIRLAAQLGSNLQGVLYVLDEPTIGLHPRDNARLLGMLEELKHKGNSLLVVEHDEATLRASDYLIDLGPGAGTQGGEVIAQGSWREVTKTTGTLLGQPLEHPSRGARRKISSQTSKIKIKNVHARNLKNFDIEIPFGRLTVLTGVSGSGKSTLMREVLLPAVEEKLASKRRRKPKTNPPWGKATGAEAFGKVIEVDQSPIGRTSRSTVATYIGLMDTIRNLFAQLPDSKREGFAAGHFSHNTPAGCCPVCKGQGFLKVEMNFLPPSQVPCEACNSRRWTEAVLRIQYRGKSIHDVLHLSVDEALEFFSALPALTAPLKLLHQTGLGYLTLGQTSPTLSGGEAQRIKLVTELASARVSEQKDFLKGRKAQSHLYLLEEPTVGLHLADVRRLLEVLHKLVDAGHTVVVIEHHLDVMAEADYLIDLGPEGGEAGGRLLFAGEPEKFLKRKNNETAKFLRTVMS